MDTVREEEGEEEEDHSPGEWDQNGVFQTVRHHTNKKTFVISIIKLKSHAVHKHLQYVKVPTICWLCFW